MLVILFLPLLHLYAAVLFLCLRQLLIWSWSYRQKLSGLTVNFVGFSFFLFFLRTVWCVTDLYVNR